MVEEVELQLVVILILVAMVVVILMAAGVAGARVDDRASLDCVE